MLYTSVNFDIDAFLQKLLIRRKKCDADVANIDNTDDDTDTGDEDMIST